MIYIFGHNYYYTDTDSIISSIVLAEILKQRGEKAQAVIINENAVKDSALRILNKIGEVPIPRLATKEELEENDIALVDHNNPIESYGRLGLNKKPILCIDHHFDVGTDIPNKIIEKVGSTCTILAEIIKNEGINISDFLARAMVYAIVCDTKGLKSRKKTQRDLDILKYLYSNYKIGTPLEEVIKDVVITTDISSIDTMQILNNSLKEYKEGRIGVASVEVLADEYDEEIEAALRHGWDMNYSLYVFTVYKQEKNKTIIYYFDKDYREFPISTKHEVLLSRSQDIVPSILENINSI